MPAFADPAAVQIYIAIVLHFANAAAVFIHIPIVFHLAHAAAVHINVPIVLDLAHPAAVQVHVAVLLDLPHTATVDINIAVWLNLAFAGAVYIHALGRQQHRQEQQGEKERFHVGGHTLVFLPQTSQEKPAKPYLAGPTFLPNSPMKHALFLAALVCALFLHVRAQDPQADSLAQAALALPNDSAKVDALLKTVAEVRDRSQTLPFQLLDSALCIAQRIHYPVGQGMAYVAFSALRERRGELEKAQEDAVRAIVLLDSVDHDRGLARAYNQLGNIRRLSGNIAEAIEFYKKSLAIREQLDPTSVGVPLANIGSLYMDLKKPEEGLIYLERAMKVFEANGDSALMSRIYNAIGEVYQSRKEHAIAAGYFLKSIQVARAIDDREALQYTYENISEVYRQRKEYDKAIEFGELSLHLAEELGFETELIQSGHSLGSTYLIAGQPEQAIALAERLQPIARERQLVMPDLNFLNLLSKAHLRALHPEQAAYYRREYEARRAVLLNDPATREALLQMEAEQVEN